MGLNKAQERAVNTINGQLLVVSCPGSGKTTVIIDRAQKMLEEGVSPENILVITFTKEAALQMKERFEKKYGKTKIFFGTIHSICFRAVMRAYGYSVDNILREYEQWDFFRSYLAPRVHTDDMESLIKKVMADVTLQRNAGIPIKAFTPKAIKKADYNAVMDAYGTYKDENHKIDYDDMLVMTRELFLSNEEELSFWKNKFQYIMIDEYQDTNKIQADIFYMLAGDNGNICVVGDDDQSIYRFRAADSSIMFDFQKHYTNTEVIYLDTNYRSEPAIIKHASNLIKWNKNRFQKDFKAFKTGKGIVLKTECKDTSEENKMVLKMIQDKHLHGTPYKEIAVLYRTNAENQLLIGMLMQSKIPFYVTDTPKDFHDDFIFQDIMAYYRMSRGKEKKGDVKRVLNRPTRYLKAEPFKDCMFNHAEMLRICSQLENKYNAICKVEEMFCDVELLATKEKPIEFINTLSTLGYADAIDGYCDFCMRDKSEAKDLFKTIKEEAMMFDTMEEWITYSEVYATEIQRLKKEKRKEGVCLSTFHSAKGLEWDKVIILNAVEDNCPHKKAESPEDIEEERRLFYVAFTRARDAVNILYYKDKKEKKDNLSRFVKEMGV